MFNIFKLIGLDQEQNASSSSDSAPSGQTGKDAPQDSAGSGKDEKLNFSPDQELEDSENGIEEEEDFEDEEEEEEEAELESVLDIVRGEDFRQESDALFFRNFMIQSGAMPGNADPHAANPEILRSVAQYAAMAALDPGLHGNTLHWDNREELLSALKKLEAIGAAQETQDYFTVLMYGGVCFALERYAKARDAFQQLDKMHPEDESLRSFSTVMETYIPRAFTVPMFMINYISRGRRAWNEVQEKGPDALKAVLKESDDNKGFLRLTQMLQTFEYNSGLFAVASPLGLKEAVQSPDAKIPFYFRAENLDLDYYPIQFTIGLMPDELKDRWEPRIGGPNIFEIGDAKIGEFGDAFRIRVTDTPQHAGADVQVYHKSLLQLNKMTPGAAQNTVQVLVEMLLGGLPTAVNIHSLTVSEARFHRRTSHGLWELPQLLDEMGYSTEVSEQDYLRKLHRTYLHKPDSASKLLRADISSGWTECGRLVDEYEQGAEDAFVHFMDLGVAAVFVAWPNSIMNCPEAEFVRRLTNFVDGAEGKGDYTVIGQASGTKYCYLDLLVYTMPVMIRALEAFFRTIPGGSDARLQAFRRASLPVPVQFSKISEGMMEWSSVFRPATKENSGSQQKGSHGHGNGKRKRKK